MSRVPDLSRRRWGNLVVAVLLLTLLGTTPSAWAVATNGGATEGGTVELGSTDLDAWLDGLVPTLLAREAIPGAVVSVVHEGEVVTERGYGLATTGAAGVPQRPVDPSATGFRVGSISKLVVATAAMQVVEGGALDLDEPVAPHLPFELRTRFDPPITMRHLLTHTAGFEDQYRHIILPPETPVPELGELLATDPPEQIFAPGSMPAYSNYGAALAAYVVERVTGRDFAEYARTEVLDAAGMVSASFQAPHRAPHLADAYPTTHGEPLLDELVGLWPAGSLTATGSDMSAFMLAQLDYEGSPLLEAAALEAMHAPALGDKELGDLAAGLRMGLGFFQLDVADTRVVGHGGDVIHSHALLHLYPDDRAGIFVGLNGSGTRADSSSAFRSQLLNGFTQRYFPGTDLPGGPEPTSAEHAAEVAGRYILSRRAESTFARTFNLIMAPKVRADGDAISIPLLTDASGEPVRLVEVEPWVWQDEDGTYRVAMRLDDDGALEAMSIDPAFVLQPQPVRQAVAQPVLAGSLLVLLGALVTWPVRAAVGWRLGAPLRLSPLDTRLRRLAMLAAVGVAVALGLWTAVALTILGGGTASTVLLRSAQFFTAVGVAGVIPATWRAVRAWTSRAWWGASLASLVALGFAGFGYGVALAGLLIPNLAY